jgi:1-phosphatidylinositol-3-phosphate 5-kinase
MEAKSDYTSLPPQPRHSGFAHSGGKATRGKPRSTGKEKGPSRPASASGSRQLFRRPSSGPGGKVGNIAKHFERINKETERANRRYAVIRGKRARPVASARARVEILESVKDAIMDESESSDSSSEADDEGGDEDDGKKTTDQATTESSPESSSTLPQEPVQHESDVAKTTLSTEDIAAPQTDDVSPSQIPNELEQQGHSPLALEPHRDAANSLPPSPFLNNNSSVTPPMSDLDSGTDRNSIFKAFSGFWPPQLPSSRIRVELDGEDPMSDPEHIFRDSSMVVRTDEPTSIIALALK